MKLFLADLTAKLAKLRCSSPVEIDPVMQSDLTNLGYHLVPNFIDGNTIDSLYQEVKSVHKKSPFLKVYDDGADQRIFGIDRVSEKFDFFINNALFDYYSYTEQGYQPKTKLIMSNILAPLDANLGSGGGWHRDSPYRNQFKAFLFLTDVSMDNGPLCFVEKSHLSSCIKKVAHVLNKPLSEYRFTDEEVETAVNKLNLKKVFVTCTAGTMLIANVRGLHRGIPIKQGERVALTNYYFKNNIPEHFGVPNESLNAI